jgi:radical SAM superfamily enzyme YgiQ (UPF0313 family)
MREQARRHQTSNFLFLDIKLNSNPAMFRGIAEQVQTYIPGAQWVGQVHVDQRKDNALSPRDLRAAVTSGMRRVSFGLESGSQRLLDAMDKGCKVEANAQFIHDAYDAGLSVRCTMFKGFPGETAEDLEQTAAFLEQHGSCIDRVRFNEINIIHGTPLYAMVRDEPSKFPQLKVVARKPRIARVLCVNSEVGGRAYRKAKARALRAVFQINRREVRSVARAFDGVM